MLAMKKTSAMKRLERTTTRENLWLYILSTLKRKRAYAYGLGKEMEKRFGWKHGLITSYLVLYKLEADGLISSKYEKRRKYYSITEKGKKELKQAKKYLRELARKL